MKEDNRMNNPGHYPDRKGLGLPYPVIWLLFVTYILLLVYGILFPLSGWRPPDENILKLILLPSRGHLSKTDLLTNVVVFVPLGVLIPFLFSGTRRKWAIIFLSLVFGGALSFGLECLQAYLPQRVSSIWDIALNAGGTAVGAAFSIIFFGDTSLGRHLYSFRGRHFIEGNIANIGLIALALWIVSQLSPLVPSIDIGNLRTGVKPVWHVLTGEKPFILMHAVTYFTSIASLGFMVYSLSRARAFAYGFFTLAVFAVLFLKVPVISRQLSLEALSGSIAALVFILIFLRAKQRPLLFLAAILLVASYLSETLNFSNLDFTVKTSAFNWVPFKGHMHSIAGLIDIVWDTWIFLGLGYAVRRFNPRGLKFPRFLFGGLFIFGMTFFVEWSQQFAPGRVPDITDVFLAVIAWSVAWWGDDIPAAEPVHAQPRGTENRSFSTR